MRRPREQFLGKPSNGAIYEELIAEPRERFDGHLASVVSQHPEARGGGLVFAGTEVPVRDLIEHLKSGELLNDFTSHRHATVTRAQAVAYLEATLHIAERLTRAK